MSQAFSDLKIQFARRFEPEGDGYVFHHRLTQRGYRVTAQERDRFVAEYELGADALSKMVVVGVVLAFVAGLAVVVVDTFSGGNRGYWVMGVLLTLVVAGAGAGSHRLWGAPLRSLQGRPAEVEPLSRREARRTELRRMDWALFAGAAAWAIPCFWRYYSRDPGLTGEGRIWLGLGVAVLLVVGVQALRKFLVMRRGRR